LKYVKGLMNETRNSFLIPLAKDFLKMIEAALKAER